MKHDAQLTQEQRYPIDAYRKAGLNQAETAKKLRVDKSTISREIRRNRGPTGRPAPAGANALSGPPGREPWIPDRGFRLATGGDPDPAGVEPGRNPGAAGPGRPAADQPRVDLSVSQAGPARPGGPCTGRYAVSDNDASAMAGRSGGDT